MIDYNDHALLLNESYRHWTGEVLAALNQANFVLMSHGMEARIRQRASPAVARSFRNR